MTNQELFDTVKNHLLTQNAKSEAVVNTGLVCAYRGEDGLKCAAGCLIPDILYKPAMERQTWPTNYNNINPIAVVMWYKFTPEQNIMIHELQTIHDHKEVCEWPKYLEQFRLKHNLC